MSELIGAGESGWWIPGESGSACDLYLALKKLSENPLVTLKGSLVREKQRFLTFFYGTASSGARSTPPGEDLHNKNPSLALSGKVRGWGLAGQ